MKPTRMGIRPAPPALAAHGSRLGNGHLPGTILPALACLCRAAFPRSRLFRAGFRRAGPLVAGMPGPVVGRRRRSPGRHLVVLEQGPDAA